MKKRTKFILCILIGYTFLLFYWMIFGFNRTVMPDYSYNLTPFATIRWFWMGAHLSLWERMVNLVGNVVVFIPFGILLPPFFQGKFKQSFLLFFCVLFLFETIQLLTKRGSFDTDDFILNSLGFCLGYCLFRFFNYCFKRICLR
ncbi:MAG: VanZ family protein [Dysgonamonadaceae bacterium]|jgi:glycopeptide antibiotics resistance protein|nr:VanZ family protein [Dysgonamonadaceae bacterium]